MLGTPFVFQVKLIKQQGNDYFCQVIPIGVVGQQAGVYVDGEGRLLVLTVGKSKTVVISETTTPFSVKKGNAYQFKLTAQSKPKFVAGSKSFTVYFVKQVGNN